MSRVLIVNADDFARTPGVSAGILRAHLEGIVTTTTVMMNVPEAVEALGMAIASAPRLGLGVHLNLTFGCPLTPPEAVPSLVDGQGRFHPIKTIADNPEILKLQDVEREWKAQIDRFLTTGAVVDHLDSHHHAAMLRPDLLDLYLTLARSNDCGVRLSWPSEQDAGPLTELFSPTLRHFAEHEAPRQLELAAVPHPDYFFGSFYGPTATLDHLLEIVVSLPEGVSEIMSHPGNADEPLLATSGYSRPREVELAALTDPTLLAGVEERGIRLATFQAAWRSGA